ncbi:YegP family protein [Arsenophonus apicola]|uniref:YegP family protein n=1 Tax=Arsenophonus apicola TaxID=2879119 RepID=UPI003879EC81
MSAIFNKLLAFFSIGARMGYYEIKKSSKSTDQPYYFVLKAANHEVIATSEMYKTKAAVQKGITSVQKNGPTKQVKDLTSET